MPITTSKAKLQALLETDPVAAGKLLQSLSKYVVVPHEGGQKEVLEHPARFKVLNAGRRWGKTKVGAKRVVQKAREPNQMIWWVAPTYKVVKRGYAEVLRQLPPHLIAHTPPPESNFDAGRSVILRLKNGTKIEFYSAERPEGMLGEGVDFAILDEAAIMPPRIWHQIVRPTLMDREGEAMMISTPRGKNWFYQVWLKGQDEQDHNWMSWTFPSATNPTLPEGEIDEMARDLPKLEYDQEVLATFTSDGSSVFTWPEQAVESRIVLRNGMLQGAEVRGEYVVLGIDLAKTNDWTVIYGARTSDRRNVYFERMNSIRWHEQKRRIRRAVATLTSAGASGVLLMIDSTGLGDPILEDLEMDGYDVVGINFSGVNKPNMVKLLAKDLERAHAFILEVRKIEFESYAMNLTPTGKPQYSAPEGEHDDVVSAKMLQHWGLVNEGAPGVTVLEPGVATATGPDGEPAFPVLEADPFADHGYTDLDDDWSDLVDDDPLGTMEAIGVEPSPLERQMGEALRRARAKGF